MFARRGGRGQLTSCRACSCIFASHPLCACASVLGHTATLLLVVHSLLRHGLLHLLRNGVRGKALVAPAELMVSLGLLDEDHVVNRQSLIILRRCLSGLSPLHATHSHLAPRRPRVDQRLPYWAPRRGAQGAS